MGEGKLSREEKRELDAEFAAASESEKKPEGRFLRRVLDERNRYNEWSAEYERVARMLDEAEPNLPNGFWVNLEGYPGTKEFFFTVYPENMTETPRDSLMEVMRALGVRYAERRFSGYDGTFTSHGEITAPEGVGRKVFLKVFKTEARNCRIVKKQVTEVRTVFEAVCHDE